MGRKFAVEKLPLAQREYVIGKVASSGFTDDEILADVKAELGIELARSSFNRWRNKIGDVMAERYELRRGLTKSFVENLQKKGVDINQDKYKQIITNLEEYLLTSEQNLIAENPLKLLFARQEDERIKLKREKLELDKEQLAFEREKHKNAIDRVKVGAETMTDFLEYVGSDAESISFLTRHLQPFGEHLKAKYAAQT